MNVPVLNDFRPNDAVRLLHRHGVHPSGATGRVVGWFAHADPTYVVSFGAELPCVQVRPDEIVLRDDLRAST